MKFFNRKYHNQQRILLILVAAIVMLNISSPLFGNKVAILFGFTFSTSSIVIALMYGVINIVNDWKGKQVARDAVASALAVRLFFFLVLMPVVFALPTFKVQPGFEEFLGNSTRQFFAGWLSLLVAGYFVSTTFFTWLKQKMEGRNFALRYVLTDLPVYATAAAIATVVGFYGVVDDLVNLFIGNMATRMIVGLAFLPVVWFARYAIRRWVASDEDAQPEPAAAAA